MLDEFLLVSVVIPTYKRPEMLGRAINSVLRQTYPYVELLIVDDNNENDEYRQETIQFMEQYKNDSRIKYLRHKCNMNGSAARNTGIRNARGQFIAFLDDDDQFVTTKIEEQVNFLCRYPNYEGVCTNYIKRYKGKTYKVSSLKEIEDGNYTHTLLAGINDLAAGSTLMVWKRIFDEIGFFDETFKRHQDWEILIRFFRKYKLGLLSEKLVVINSDGFRYPLKGKRLEEINIYFFDKFCDDILKLPVLWQNQIIKKNWLEVSEAYLSEGKIEKASSILREKILNQNIKFKLKDFIGLVLRYFYGHLPAFKNIYCFTKGSLIYYQYNKIL